MVQPCTPADSPTPSELRGRLLAAWSNSSSATESDPRRRRRRCGLRGGCVRDSAWASAAGHRVPSYCRTFAKKEPAGNDALRVPILIAIGLMDGWKSGGRPRQMLTLSESSACRCLSTPECPRKHRWDRCSRTSSPGCEPNFEDDTYAGWLVEQDGRLVGGAGLCGDVNGRRIFWMRSRGGLTC